MGYKIVIFQNFEKLSIFKIAYFYVINYYQFYSCFLLDITFTLVPAIEFVSIWCTFDRVSILVSLYHLPLDNMKNCKASRIIIWKAQ